MPTKFKYHGCQLDTEHHTCACVRACVCVCVCVCVKERWKIELTVWGKKVPIALDGIRTCISGIRAHSASDCTTTAGTSRVSRMKHFRHSPVSSIAKQSCMKDSVCACVRVRAQAWVGVSQRKESAKRMASTSDTNDAWVYTMQRKQQQQERACVRMSQLEERSGRRVSSTSGTPFKKAVVNTTQRKLEQQNEAHLISSSMPFL